MKKLPKLYTNSFDKKIDNSREYVKVKDEIKEEEKKFNNYEINKKIDTIFKSKNYIYKVDVIIKLKNQEVSTTLIGKTNDNLITIDNKLIKISEICDIKKVD